MSIPIAVASQQPTLMTMNVTIPKACMPGQQFNFQANGATYCAVVPEGYSGGMELSVQVPAPIPVASVVMPMQQHTEVRETVVIRSNENMAPCRGCGRDFVRKERDKGSARYYRCSRCTRTGFSLW